MKTVVRKRTGGLIQALAIGLGVCVVLMLLLTAVFAYGMEKELIKEKSVGYMAAGVLILCVVCGALTAARLYPQRRLLVCLGLGGVFFLVLLLCAALFFDGEFDGLPVTLALVFGSAVAAGLLGAGRTGKKKGRYKGYPS